ncbi:hypothetical protein [Bacillus sp. es.036]|uniref:hypothetical protein n=1 Tax=Bacillus sp. es.036 TaxID=1761764 RepID=UPI000BF8EB8D|nr:hypothetical protein [Bacillus sp. es.036]PFG14680.1 hypothetical protein ATG70_2918 [Bacillus sp. es.036]
MRYPNELSKKRRYQQGFAVIYLVIAIILATVLFDDYNVFIVGGVTILLYLLLRFLVGVYVDKKVE